LEVMQQDTRSPGADVAPGASAHLPGRRVGWAGGRGGDEASNAGTGRHETAAEQADRNMSELINELRMAKLGLQVLFGFLLALPFTARFSFAVLSSGQRALYILDLVVAAIGTALLTAPVAYHRMLFRQHEKARIVSASNAMAVWGLACIALCSSGGVWLVLTVLERGWLVALVPSVVMAAFVALFLAVPLAARLTPGRARDEV
jgi:hypothetical protein